MIYNSIQNVKLSSLGMGNMRLPIREGKPDSEIDYTRAEEIIDFAMSSGINYYDTAYVYHSGKSESFLGDALVSRYPRDSFCIATKFNYGANPDYKAVFEEQLSRLKTDYIDFYLMHAVGGDSAPKYIESGAVDYFIKQNALGRVKHLGFSAHADSGTLRKFAEYTKWDFAQLQINYFDWLFGNAKEQYQILEELGIPIVVMEPVRGGRLASLCPEAEKMLKEAHPDWSVPSWAFRWLKRYPQIKVILSGMSNMEQIQDNIRTFSDSRALTDEEEKLLFDACRIFRSYIVVPCTGCRYCTDGCPAEINIPRVLEIYNRSKTDGDWVLYQLGELEKGKPKDCVQCGSCLSHCPQGINVPEIMKALSSR